MFTIRHCSCFLSLKKYVKPSSSLTCLACGIFRLFLFFYTENGFILQFYFICSTDRVSLVVSALGLACLYYWNWLYVTGYFAWILLSKRFNVSFSSSSSFWLIWFLLSKLAFLSYHIFIISYYFINIITDFSHHIHLISTHWSACNHFFSFLAIFPRKSILCQIIFF